VESQWGWEKKSEVNEALACPRSDFMKKTR
jgi:hypothetical protein